MGIGKMACYRLLSTPIWRQTLLAVEIQFGFNFSRKNANCQYAKSGRTVDTIYIVNMVNTAPKKMEKVVDKSFWPFSRTGVYRTTKPLYNINEGCAGRVNGTRKKGGFLPSFFRSVVFGKVYFTVRSRRFSRNRLFRRSGWPGKCMEKLSACISVHSEIGR